MNKYIYGGVISSDLFVCGVERISPNARYFTILKIISCGIQNMSRVAKSKNISVKISIHVSPSLFKEILEYRNTYQNYIYDKQNQELFCNENIFLNVELADYSYEIVMIEEYQQERPPMIVDKIYGDVWYGKI